MKTITAFLLCLCLGLGALLPAAQAQSCPAPTVTGVTRPVPGTLVISFTPVATASQYVVRYFWAGDSTAGKHRLLTNSSPATLTGLITPAYYVVSVGSICSPGDTVYSPAQMVSTTNPGAPCASVSGLQASALTSSSAAVSFGSSGALSYTIRYYIAGTALVNTITTNSPGATLTGLQASQTYVVQVSANCAGSSSGWVSTTFTTPAAATCAAVTNLSVSGVTSSSAAVSFPSSGAPSYTIRYYVAGTSAPMYSVNLSSTATTLSGLQPSTTYVVQVRANCSNSAASAWTSATFQTSAATPPPPCGAVTNVVVTATSDSTATVSFTPGVNNTSFWVTYGTANDSARWVRTNSSPVTLTGLVPGQTYYIQVNSICGGGSGTLVYSSSSPVTFGFRGTSVTSARRNLGAGQLDVYPNPAQGAVELALPAVPGATTARVTLLNALGQQVKVSQVALTAPLNRARLDLTGLAPGLYTVRVAAGSQSASQRLLVQP